MGYFDNPENRRAWEAELGKLTRERERRAGMAASEPDPVDDADSIEDIEIETAENEIETEDDMEIREPDEPQDLHEPYNPDRIPITYEQLLHEAGYKPSEIAEEVSKPADEKQIEIQSRRK